MLPANTEFWLPSVWIVMTERVAAFRTYFSRRRADTVTVGTSLSPHCLRVCGAMNTVSSSRLHHSLQLVIVSPLWGVDYMLYRNISSFFVLRVPTFSTCIVCRICLVKLRPTPSCSSSFGECNEIVGKVWIWSLRSPSLLVVHHQRCGFASMIVVWIY